MTITRRDFLKGLVIVPTAAALPGAMVHAMMAPPAAGSRNIIFVDLKGGNDGLNMIVPSGLNGGSYYSEFRPTLGLPQGSLLSLSADIGMNPALAALHSHFQAGRLAVCQGCSYPDPSKSHEVSQRVWNTGDPAGVSPDGWMGRFLAGEGPAPTPCAVTVMSSLSTLMKGSGSFVPAFEETDSFVFPFDWDHWNDQDNRRAAYAAMATGLSDAGGDLEAMAGQSQGLLDLITTFDALPEFTHVGTYPEGSSLADRMRVIARLMGAGLGMRYFHVARGGFDTHSEQNVEGKHDERLADVAQCIDGLYADLSSVGLADDTLIVVFSEFGRTVYENGSAGTDHGTVGPVLVLGNGVTGGITTPHPSMDPADLDPETGELPMTTDFRDVFGTIVNNWVSGDASVVFPGHTLTDLGFLT